MLQVHHKTALHEASSRGWTEVVAALLQAGAEVDCCDLQVCRAGAGAYRGVGV